MALTNLPTGYEPLPPTAFPALSAHSINPPIASFQEVYASLLQNLPESMLPSPFKPSTHQGAITETISREEAVFQITRDSYQGLVTHSIAAQTGYRALDVRCPRLYFPSLEELMGGSGARGPVGITKMWKRELQNLRSNPSVGTNDHRLQSLSAQQVHVSEAVLRDVDKHGLLPYGTYSTIDSQRPKQIPTKPRLMHTNNAGSNDPSSYIHGASAPTYDPTQYHTHQPRVHHGRSVHPDQHNASGSRRGADDPREGRQGPLHGTRDPLPVDDFANVIGPVAELDGNVRDEMPDEASFSDRLILSENPLGKVNELARQGGEDDVEEVFFSGGKQCQGRRNAAAGYPRQSGSEPVPHGLEAKEAMSGGLSCCAAILEEWDGLEQELWEGKMTRRESCGF